MADDDAGDGGAFEEDMMSQKDLNVSMLRDGDMEVQYAPVLPFLSVPDRKKALFAQFKLPGGVVRDASTAGPRKTLGARRKRKMPSPTGGAFAPPKILDASALAALAALEEEGAAEEAPPPPPAAAAPADIAFEPLVLFQAPEGTEGGRTVSVDPILCKFLREHQREGVQFMFDCVHGLKGFDGKGCILADDMGLGKTLQSITLLFTCLRQGIVPGTHAPTAKRAIVVCPTSLVMNWAKEIGKWVGETRLKCIALAEASRDKAIMDINTFLSPGNQYPVLILSYETFRIHAPTFHARPDACDLLICDEAHRLKNDKTLTTQALAGLACRRRVLLSGTPMQNDLDEFWSMVDFTNPGVLGDAAAFRKRYSGPILAAREPWASDRVKAAGDEASKDLSNVVNQFILRRTNSLLSKHLPPKLLQVVCVKLSPLQQQLYDHFLSSKELDLIMSGSQKGVLSSITALRKLVNHPRLIYDVVRTMKADKSGGKKDTGAAGFEDCEKFFPDNFHRERSACVDMSGKFALAARMLTMLRHTTDDRIVIVSCYTQTLDLFTALCRENSWPFIRLDGSTAPGKRQKLVDRFNDPKADEFVFLLSSKAGGCGLNLIGGNRLILFDPDWNPATDLQAAARVWRDGQKKKVYVYRFLATGTLEEKVFQRQLSKKGLQTIVVEEGDEVNMLSSDDLRNLFAINGDTPSDTHDMLRCMRCRKAEIADGESDDEMAEEAKRAVEADAAAKSTAAAATAAAGSSSAPRAIGGAGIALDDEEGSSACAAGDDDDGICDSGRASKVRRLTGTACVATAATAEATISPATTSAASGVPSVETPAAPRSAAAAAAGGAARAKTPGSASSGGVIEIVDSDDADDEEMPAVSAILKRGTNTTAGGSDATKSFLSPTAPVSTSALLATSISIHASAPLSVTAGASGAAAAAAGDDMPPLMRTAAPAPTTSKSPVVRAAGAPAAAGGVASPASTVVDDGAAAGDDDEDDDVVVSGAVRRNPLAGVASSNGADSDAALAAKLAAEEQMKRDAELAAVLAGSAGTGRRSASTRRAAATASRDADADEDAFFDVDDDSSDDGGGGRRKGKRGGKGKSVSGAKRGRGSMGDGKPVSKAAQKRLSKAQEAERKAMEDAIAVAIKESLQKPLDPVEPGTVRRQLKWPGEDDLKHWSHHCGVDGVADTVLQETGKDLVSFVFGLEVQGRDLSEFAKAAPPASAGAASGSSSSSASAAASSSSAAGSGAGGGGMKKRIGIGGVRRPGSAAGSSSLGGGGGGFKSPFAAGGGGSGGDSSSSLSASASTLSSPMPRPPAGGGFKRPAPIAGGGGAPAAFRTPLASRVAQSTSAAGSRGKPAGRSPGAGAARGGAKPAGKAGGKAAAKPKKGRKGSDDDEDEGDFLASDDDEEEPEPSDESEDEEEEEEQAESSEEEEAAAGGDDDGASGGDDENEAPAPTAKAAAPAAPVAAAAARPAARPAARTVIDSDSDDFDTFVGAR